MCLVARELERRGIATVAIILLREVAEKVPPPRGLAVPFDWGQPLGPPGEGALHREVALRALALLERGGEAPVLEELSPT